MTRRAGFWIALALFAGGAYLYIWNVLPQNLMPLEQFQRLRDALR